MKIIATSLLALIAMCLLLALTGCTVTMNADGSKSATVDAPTAIKVLEIIATK